MAIAQPGKDGTGFHVISPRNWLTDTPRTRVCPQIIRLLSSDRTRCFRRLVTNHPDSVHYRAVDTVLCAALPAERPDWTGTSLQ